MGNNMAKENNNVSVFRETRDELNLTRQETVERLGNEYTVDILEKLENGKRNLTPYDAVKLSEVYKKPDLCNHYCINICEIGKKFINPIKPKELSQIVLETIHSLDEMEEHRKRFVDISIDGEIKDEELIDFVKIAKELEKVSMTIDSLKLWIEQTRSSGSINTELYDKLCQDYEDGKI